MMEKTFEFVTDVIDLAKSREVKIESVSVSDFQGKKENYDLVELCFLNPRISKEKLEMMIEELRNDTGIKSRKDEV